MNLKPALAPAVCISLLALIGTAFAQDGKRPPERPAHGHRQPPPEAFEACEDLKDGDDCSVEIHDHTIEGTCRQAPNDEDALVCIPKHHGPPPESHQACNDEGSGDGDGNQ